jgi:hypothetical protein
VKKIVKILGVFAVLICFSINSAYCIYPLSVNKCPVSSEKPDIIKESPLSFYLHIDKIESSVKIFRNYFPALQKYSYNHFSAFNSDPGHQENNPFINNFSGLVNYLQGLI